MGCEELTHKIGFSPKIPIVMLPRMLYFKLKFTKRHHYPFTKG